MDVSKAEENATPTSLNGPGTGQNQFDLSALLGPSAYSAALSSIYSNMPGGASFSLFGSHPGMFGGSPTLPFAGLGSFGDSLLSAAAGLGAGGSLDSSANNASTEWLRMATEQVRQLSESPGAAALYPGLAAGLSNPLLASMFAVPSSTIPTSTFSSSLPSSARNSKSPAVNSSAAGTLHRSSTTPRLSSASPSSTSSSSSKQNRDQQLARQTKSEQRRNSEQSRTGTADGIPIDTKSSGSAVALKTNSSDMTSLENSLLSAESALYAASPMFFPFSLFNGSTPFQASSSLLSDKETVLTPSKESLPKSPASKSLRPSSNGRHTTKSVNSAETVASTSSPSRMSEPGRNSESRRNSLNVAGAETKYGATSVIVKSPPVAASPDKYDASPLREKVSKDRTSQGRSSEIFNNTSHKSSISPAVHANNHHGSDTPSSLKRRASPRPPSSREMAASYGSNKDGPMAFSEDGAIDLSVKKPRHSVSPHPGPTVDRKATPLNNRDLSSLSANSSSNAAMISQSLAAQLQPLMAELAEQSGFSELSFSLAAAAAGLFPPFFDPSMFYQPSVLAAMAASSQNSASSSSASQASMFPEKPNCRGRGRRRGSGRGGRTSSMFISSLFAQQQSAALGGAEEVRVSRGRGSRGRGRGRGQGRPRKDVAPTMLADIEAQRRQYLDQLLQQHGQSSSVELTVGSGSAKASKEQSRNSVHSALLDSKSRHHGNSACGSNIPDKSLHRSSKQSVSMLSDRRRTDSLGSLELDSFFKMAADRTPSGSGHGDQKSSVDHGGSVRTDSDAVNEETSSACSSETVSEADGQSARGSEADVGATWCDKKRSNTSEGHSVKKRRRTILDESVVQVPLQRGWQRETRVRSFTPRKIIGEVLYITPCDRRLRNYNEVDKFLEKGGISDLTRENFTFSTKVNSGKFYEQQVTGETSTWVLLTDEEVSNRFVIIEERKKRIIESKLRAQQREEKRLQSEELVARLAEARMQKRMEQQELARKVAEMKMKKKAEKEQQKEMLQRARQLRVMEVRRMRERQKLARQQERFHRQVQLKMEREVRNRQLTEEKEVRRQQDFANREQEREKRRLDLLMARAMEARKKEEEKLEKERMREERRLAKKIDHENKLAQKRWELFLAREQKKPTDDLCIIDSKPLPELERVAGLRLPGKAFSDCLMVLEFVHNYASTLGLDSESLPSLNLLQGGLMNDDGYSREFSLLTIRLLKCAIDDPGFGNPRDAVLLSGQKFVDIELSESGLSEVLRIFIKSRNGGRDNELSSHLQNTPFLAMNATQKAAILAFLCNELLCAKNVNAEIEKNIDLVTNLRRDKWIIESKLRKLRVLHAQGQRKINNPTTATPSSQSEAPATAEIAEKQTASDEIKPTESDVESDDNESRQQPNNFIVHDSDAEEDKKATLEELQAKIDKLVKQQNQLRERCFNISHKLSAMMFGQDRFHRRYWVFPKCGGIFVEGLESGDPDLSDPDAPLLEVVSGHFLISNQNGTEVTVSEITDSGNIVNQKPIVVSDVKVDAENSGGEQLKGDNDITSVDCSKSDLVKVNNETDYEISINVDVKLKLVNGDVDVNLSSCPPNASPVVNGLLPSIKTEDTSLVSSDTIISDKNGHISADLEDKSKIVTEEKSSEPPCLWESKSTEQLQSSFIESVSQSFSNSATSTPCNPRVVSTPSFTPSSSVVFLTTPSNASLSHLGTSLTEMATPRSLVDISTIGTPMSLSSKTSTPSLSSSNAAVAESFRLAMLSAAGSMQLPLEFQHIPAPNIPSVPLAKQCGWWRITNPELLKELISCLNPRGIREKNLQKTFERHMNFAILSCTRARKNAMKLEVTEESKRIRSMPTSAPTPDDLSVWDFDHHRRTELKVLEDIEIAEEKMCSASLQAKGCKATMRVTTDSSVELVSSLTRVTSLSDNQQSIIVAARTRLFNLERSVERRYLKPPLGRSNHMSLTSGSASGSGTNASVAGVGGGANKDTQNSSDDDDDSDDEDETATRELSSWRAAVSNATSASQLHLYLAQLQRCVAWEKSIMKVLCQICCHDDNEAQLLLCDMCDRGYHTYCIKPKLDNIPDGDWYCYECLSKASGEISCMACGEQFGRMLTCESCSRHIHLDCVDPPVARTPKKWSCYCCLAEKGKYRSRTSTAPSTPVKDVNPETNGSTKDMDESERSMDCMESASINHDSKSGFDTLVVSSSPATADSVGKKPPRQRDRSDKKRDRSKKDRKSENKSGAVESLTCNGTNVDPLEVCRIILSELREHVDAWPFQTPVSSKQFPTYRKVIRCPIDFQTMARKLKSGIYKCREEFTSDARLVFANCELFNEDNSLVGIAGHSMKSFFESRWKELTSTVSTDVSVSNNQSMTP